MFWDVTPHNMAEVACFDLFFGSEDGESTFLRNVGEYLLDYSG